MKNVMTTILILMTDALIVLLIKTGVVQIRDLQLAINVEIKSSMILSNVRMEI